MAVCNGGSVELRSEAKCHGPQNRNCLIGRAQNLEPLGLVDPLGPAAWTIKPGLEDTLRDLGVRGDIIKTMHKAMARDTPNPDVSRFAIHQAPPIDPVVGRLVDRGLYDELKRSEEHTSELQTLMRISYAVLCLKNKITT